MGGWGRHVVRGASSGQSHLSLTPAPGTLPPPRLWCRAQKGAEEEERRGAGGDREGRGGGGRQGGTGRFCGSVCGKVFFFSSFPFFLCKKCTKAGQPLCNGQQCFLEGGEGGRGPQAWHPSLGLKVASYCLETWVSV